MTLPPISPRRASVALLALALAAACHRPKPVAPRPLAMREEHCWWTVFHTTLSPDSVARRYAGAYTKTGFAGATWTQRGDTAWAHAGPTLLVWRGVPAYYEGRMVAYRQRDTTGYRQFIAMVRADSDGTTPGDGALRIPMCGEIAAAAAVGGLAPRDPDGEEKLAVWWSHP